MTTTNQESHYTEFNRYPEIFAELARRIPAPKRILSFGCSTGAECRTLASLYFPDAQIVGVDIDAEIVSKNNAENTYDNIQYVTPDQLKKTFDVVLAMSVLCVWPESVKPYSFELFQATLNVIDQHVAPDGYLCVYNSTYCVTDHFTSSQYEAVSTDHTETGFVTKYSSDRVVATPYPHWLFVKVGLCKGT